MDGTRAFAPDAFENVWYRRPERLRSDAVGDTAEGKFILDEWSEGLENYLAFIPRKRWVNHPTANASASRKLEQLTTARALGFLTPDSLVTQDPESLRDFAARHGGHIIAKPMSRGYVDRGGHGPDSLIYTNRVSATDLAELGDLSTCPTLFQEYIEKLIDVRITSIDGDIHAVELTAPDETGAQRCDIRRNNMEDVRHRAIDLPEEIASGVRKLMDNYGLRFAAIDMAVTRGDSWVFFEINPNGQWAWLDLAGVATIGQSFLKAFGTGK